MNNENCGIYLLTNIINGKVYVGKSINIKKRFYDHAKDEYSNYKKHTTPITNAIRKYGWNSFDKKIIEVCDKIFILEKETYWIRQYDALNRNKGYNVCEYSNDTTGYKHTKEARLKMSISHKGKKKNFSKEYIEILKSRIKAVTGPGKNNPMYGKKHTEITKNKISDTIKEKYRNGDIKGIKQVFQMDLNENIIKKWDCIRDAAKELKGNVNYSGHISNVCKGKRKTFLNFKWKYA